MRYFSLIYRNILFLFDSFINICNIFRNMVASNTIKTFIVEMCTWLIDMLPMYHVICTYIGNLTDHYEILQVTGKCCYAYEYRIYIHVVFILLKIQLILYKTQHYMIAFRIACRSQK